ncbi:zinc-dependent metalloprotease [Aquiflexum gelatinilyticum]|uniref:Zinc-dependent metalloprotease n=1 Tax=Aquiflexum gelatinilyticum TaxID=2961943 RepID=A0A9X2P577_9BACT|nr:zinc-dependent metalloprotease [Aquiflexum gelatinilyticum]MCR9016316.1 zinc-dependent metalloprotease [Aquiflexum gelatinilyticum]
MIRLKRNLLLTMAVVMVTVALPMNEALAQKKKKKSDAPVVAAPAPEKKPEKKSIAELTKGSKKFEGLFTFYQDTVSGELKMEVAKDQLGKEFIYFAQIGDGVTDAGTFRGAYGENNIFKIVRYFNRVEFVKQNVSHYFDPSNPLSRSADANISPGIMASAKIEAEDAEKGTILIKADNLFLKETFSQIKNPPFPGESPMAFRLGNLDSEKTKVLAIRSYEKNTDLAVEYVYNNPSVLNGGSSAVTDGRNVSIKVFHSLIELPDNGYEPRFDDPRVGFFTTEVTDMTSASATPFRDLIHRWDLRKKDPNAAISDPVEPIVFWIENSTPMEWRGTIMDAVLEWNKAFEKAGFKNAVQVKIQPDDADWDAGDIRYNVLRWTSSPNPPFGGYGPSFVNPRTGQILGADIMLEFVYHTNRVVYDKLFGEEAALETHTSLGNQPHFCFVGAHLQNNMMFGQAFLRAHGASDLEMEGMKKEAMAELLMHEVGHTLGLNHNMKASQLFSPKELADKNVIEGKALSGSVMDYLAINLSPDKNTQGHYFSTTVGPYDVWAIQAGYTPVKSQAELDPILALSTKPELTFGNDADDMRAPGKAIDPRVMIGDLSNDQIAYSIHMMETSKKLMEGIKEKYSKEGQSYQELTQAYSVLMGTYTTAGGVMSRYIGGVYVDRAMAGQEGATQPYTPVSLKDQKRALDAISKYMLAPNAYQIPEDLINYLARQRRGFNFFGGPEDPKIHQQVLNSQRSVLAHMTHPNTLQRMVDSELYGNEYNMATYMSDLTKAIFDADINGNVNTFRQNLQIEYVNTLKGMVTGPQSNRYNNFAKSAALYNLNYIKTKVNNSSGNVSSKAHKDHLKLVINNTLEDVK